MLLEVRGLSRHFGPIAAVDDVSFAVDRGGVLGFLGPNGAGKTTTMRMIAGFLAPSAGTAIVCGADVGQDPVAVKRHLGYLPEGAPLYIDMTPAGFLEFIAAIRGLAGSERRRRIAEVVERMQLGGVLRQRIETLSKGYRRRVALAQAILHDPDVLILDEPTDGLDPNQKHEVRELIRAMAPTKAIVISTHILEEVEALCNRAIIIARGRIVADGTPEALRARSDRHNAVTLQVPAEMAQRAADVLRPLPEVAQVDLLAPVNGAAQLLVRPANGRSITAEVGAALRASHVDVEELYSERGRLEDVFRSVTTAPSAKTRSCAMPSS
jgi:ABC-2 type transport system ATP-binding protein